MATQSKNSEATPKTNAIASAPSQPQAEVNALMKTEQPKSSEIINIGFDTWQGFSILKRIGEYIASMSMIPDNYKNNPANCSMALNISKRLNVDLLMVMQNLYFVHGRPGWSAQFAIASFNSVGLYTSIHYKWSGKRSDDTWGCRAYATEIATGETLEGPEITLGLAKKEGWYDKTGSKWKTMPELMLCYRAAAWFIRTTAPQILMGFQTQDELIDIGPGEFTVVSPKFTGDDEATKLLQNAGGNDSPNTSTVSEKADELSLVS